MTLRRVLPLMLLGQRAAVAGGSFNSAKGMAAVVAGGSSNSANGDYGTVAGGELNLASNTHATVGGGSSNDATGFYAVVAGGQSNTASGLAALEAANAGLQAAQAETNARLAALQTGGYGQLLLGLLLGAGIAGGAFALGQRQRP